MAKWYMVVVVSGLTGLTTRVTAIKPNKHGPVSKTVTMYQGCTLITCTDSSMHRRPTSHPSVPQNRMCMEWSARKPLDKAEPETRHRFWCK